MDSEVFEKLSPTKLFFRCALPSMVTMAFGAIYQIADGLFVGRFIGEDALAAVNLVMPIIMIAFAIINMVATGASVRISVLLSEKKQEEASRLFTCSLKFIFFFSLFIGTAAYIFAEPFIRFLAPGATELAIAYAITYTRVYAAFAPLMLIYFATDNYLRICGKEKLSMWIGISTQAMNIILDVILIAVLGLSVGAVAFTSCISMTVGALITLFVFRRNKTDLYYVGGRIRFATLLKVFANGSSQFFESIATSVMLIGYNFFVLKYGGTSGIAAFSVVMYVDSIVGMLMFGMCDSLQPAISYCHGKGLGDKVRAIFKRVVLGAIALSVLSLLFLMFLGQYVAVLFIKPGEEYLLPISIAGMRLFSIYYTIGWLDVCFSSLFTAIERPGRALILSFFRTVVFPLMSLFILTPYMALDGVFITPFAAAVASAILTLILAFTLAKKAKDRPR